MAHPAPSSRSLEFFLDLGNLSSTVGGGVVVEPPNNEAHWEAQGEGTHYLVEWVIYNASRTEIAEDTVGVGSIYWDSVELGLENGPNPLIGFKVTFRQMIEVITKTEVYETDPDTGEQILVDIIWNGTRTYPEAALNSATISCSMDKVPSLWPRQIDTPAEQEFRDRVFGENREDNWSTNIRAPEFEGVTLYGTDQTSTSAGNPGVLGIVEGATRCEGFVTNGANLGPNLLQPGGYFIEEGTVRGYVRTPDNKIEPLPTTNGGAIGRVLPVEGGTFAGRIDHPDELPFSTEEVPIPIGTTYIQQVPARLRPFPEYIGQFAWSYVGVERPDPDSPTGDPIRDRDFNIIEDFMWQRSTSAGEISGYIYPLVFDESIFSYIQRQAGPFIQTIYVVEPALTGLWYPVEPFDPDAEPYPIYPMDTIPDFVPGERETIDVHYTFTCNGALASGSLGVSQTTIAPTRNWKRMLTALLQRCYYTHGISRSYATVPGYCNPDSPNYGENFTDPFCLNERGETVTPWIVDGEVISNEELIALIHEKNK